MASRSVMFERASFFSAKSTSKETVRPLRSRLEKIDLDGFEWECLL